MSRLTKKLSLTKVLLLIPFILGTIRNGRRVRSRDFGGLIYIKILEGLV